MEGGFGGTDASGLRELGWKEQDVAEEATKLTGTGYKPSIKRN